MGYRELGGTGLKVSEIGIGAYPISGLQTRPDGTQTGWPGVEDDESVALIHRAEAAAKKRILEACEGSLRRLKMETIDLYQLHAIPHGWASETVMGALAQLKQEGKVRFYGISTNDQAAIERLRSFG